MTDKFDRERALMFPPDLPPRKDIEPQSETVEVPRDPSDDDHFFKRAVLIVGTSEEATRAIQIEPYQDETRIVKVRVGNEIVGYLDSRAQPPNSTLVIEGEAPEKFSGAIHGVRLLNGEPGLAYTPPAKFKRTPRRIPIRLPLDADLSHNWKEK